MGPGELRMVWHRAVESRRRRARFALPQIYERLSVLQCTYARPTEMIIIPANDRTEHTP
jgi:hypothetical protein